MYGPTDPPPLRWPLLVTLVGVLLAAVVVVILGDVSVQTEVVPSAITARQWPQPVPATVPRPRPGAATAATPIVRIKSPSSIAKPGHGEVEVCGLGIVKSSQGDASGSGQIPQSARQAAYERLWPAMQSSADERVRAAGWLLESRLLELAVRSDDDARSSACAPDDLACKSASERSSADQRSAAKLPLAATRAIDRLAQLAASSRDPFVYRLAAEACRIHLPSLVPDGACQLVSAEQWVRIDPSNATPWLHLAELARARQDPFGEAEAIYRASIATSSNEHWGALPRLVSQTITSDTQQLSKTIAINDAWGVQMSFAPLASPTRHCSADAVRDSNRRQTCEALATLLVDKGRTSLDAKIAHALGEHVGWPKERLQALQDEQQMLAEAAWRHISGDGMLSCEGVQRMAQWARTSEQLGELGAARDLVRRSGRTLDEATREYARRRETLRSAEATAPTAGPTGGAPTALATAR